MEAERKAIEDAFEEVVANLAKCKAHWLQEISNGAQGYEGLTKDDAFIWFIECM